MLIYFYQYFVALVGGKHFMSSQSDKFDKKLGTPSIFEQK